MQKESAFWILWCPTSNLPPTVRYHTAQKARDVAAAMAWKHPGQEFIIMRAEASATREPVTIHRFVEKGYL